MSEKRLPIQLKRELREKLKELKPLIPKGAIKKLSIELEMSTNIIYDVIGGRRWNLEIIEKLIEIGKDNFKRAEKANNELDKLLDANRKAT